MRLKSIMRSNPTVLYERDDYNNGFTLLHHAVMYRSVELVKVLVEADGGLECVRLTDRYGRLPFHAACSFYNVEVANYLHSLYPESINIRYNDGNSALQSFYGIMVAMNKIARKRRDSYGSTIKECFQHLIYAGRLPLHIACVPYCPLSIVKLVYDAYPEALHVRTRGGATLLDIARGKKAEVAQFLAGQLEQARQIIQPGGTGSFLSIVYCELLSRHRVPSS